MNILFFIAEQNWGVTSLLAGQAYHLDRINGLEFTFVAGTTEKERGLFDLIKRNGLSVSQVEGIEFHKNFTKLCVLINSIIEEKKPEIIHVQTNWQLALISFIKYRYKRTFSIYYTIHAFRHNYKYRSIVARGIMIFFLSIFVKRVVACSKYTYNKFKVLKKKLCLIHLGIDDLFYENIYNKMKDNSRHINIAFIGEFRSGKNQELLINTMSEVLTANPSIDVSLTLPGIGVNLDKCRILASNLRLDNHVFFPGFLTKRQVRDLLINTDISIIPTNSETFGLCIAEAYASGCCVISRSVGIAPEIIQNGINGFLFTNDEELKYCLLNLLINLRNIEKCGQNAFHDRYRFSWSELSKKYNLLYRNLI